MIIRTVAFAAVIAFGNTGAAAQDIGGRYKTECKLQNGASCSGTVEVEMTSENTCRIKWSDGTTGICMLKGGVFSYAGIVHQVPQLGFYEVSADGTIEGVFIDDYHGAGFGKEKMVPVP